MGRSSRQDHGGGFADPERPGFADVLADVDRGIRASKSQQEARQAAREQSRRQEPSDDDRLEQVEVDNDVRDRASVERTRSDKDEADGAEPEQDASEELAATAAAAAQAVQPLTAQLVDEAGDGDAIDVEEPVLQFAVEDKPRSESARPQAAQVAPAAPAAAATVDLPGAELPGADIGAHRALDLVSPQEMADQDVQLETEGGEMMERLQQALAANSSEDLDELGKPVVPQVVRSMATLARNGVSEMRLQLQPGDLGEIELRVRAVEGMIRGEVMVQHTEVKNLLDSQIERLREALEAQGLRLDGFDVGVSDDGAFARDRDADAESAGRPFASLLEGDSSVEDDSAPISAVPRRPIQLTEDAVDWLV